MKTNESRILWETHKYSPIVGFMRDSTLFQKYWLMTMASQDLGYKETIDTRLTGIAKGVGIEFKKKR